MSQQFNTLLTITSLLFGTAVTLPSLPGPSPPNLDLGSPLLAPSGGNATTFAGITTSPLVLGSIDPLINCDGAKYRTCLSTRSCQDAVDQIPRDARSLRFALRRTGNHDVVLPFRFISCECWERWTLVTWCAFDDHFIVDGLCIVDIVLKDGVSMAMASYQELSRAANGLVERCVSPNQVGGIAMDLGKAQRIHSYGRGLRLPIHLRI